MQHNKIKRWAQPKKLPYNCCPLGVKLHIWYDTQQQQFNLQHLANYYDIFLFFLPIEVNRENMSLFSSACSLLRPKWHFTHAHTNWLDDDHCIIDDGYPSKMELHCQEHCGKEFFGFGHFSQLFVMYFISC